jgi:uncharacterized phiE125 gp8 family phage protein
MKILNQEQQEVISLEAVKRHLRISGAHDDALIEELIKAAVYKAEQATWLSFTEKEIEIEAINEDGVITLPTAPVESVDVVEYWDGTEWVETASYSVYGNTYTQVVISTGYRRVRVTFTTGVKEHPDLVRLMYELVGVWYDNRPDVDMLEANIVTKISKYKLCIAG